MQGWHLDSEAVCIAGQRVLPRVGKRRLIHRANSPKDQSIDLLGASLVKFVGKGEPTAPSKDS